MKHCKYALLPHAKYFFLLLLLGIPVYLSAQNNTGKNTGTSLPVINIKKTSWKVLFSGFVNHKDSSQAPSSEIEKLLVSVARSLKQLNHHVLDENEKNDLRKNAIKKELYKHYKEYNSLVDQRDRAVINSTLKDRSRLSQITAQSNEEKKINEKRQLIRRIERINTRSISVPDILPLEFESHVGKSYRPPNIILLNEDYDIFIWGISRGKNNVFQVEIRAYLANAKREISLWKGIVGSSNYEEVLEMIQARVSSLLLGRPWAAMEINVETVDNIDSRIYLDGKLHGVNNLNIYGLHPERSYELEFIANGLEGKRVFVELEPGKLNRFQFKLDTKVETSYINVNASAPADVYLGVRYLGTTPLKIQVPSYDTLLVLVAEGKRTINYDLQPKQQTDLFFNLEIAPQITLKEENDKFRTRFYRSSTLFTISLALPLLATGIALVNWGLYRGNRFNSDGPMYQQNSYIGFGIAIGGGVLSAIFLGLNIYDFSRYAKSTRALATTEFTPRKVSPEEASSGGAPKNTSAEEPK